MSKEINIQELKELGFYLEGQKLGSGSLYPLGNIHLENIWNTIKKLEEEKEASKNRT